MSAMPDEPAAGAGRTGLTLLVESSTARGSVALLDGATLVAATDVALRARDAEHLMPAVDATLREAGMAVRDLARVACGAGPGSFTGLRIGAAIAKGLAHALGRPLHAVPSLLLAGGEAAARFGPGRYLVSVDALRGERYVLLVNAEHTDVVHADGAVQLVSGDAVARIAEERGARIVGPDHGDVWPHARALGRCLHALGEPCDLASWEPAYGRLAEAQAKWERVHGRALTGA